VRKGMRSMVATLAVVASGFGVGVARDLWSPVGARSAGAATGPRVLAAAPASRVVITDADPDAQKWRFEPADTTVKKGSTVVWHNDGKQTHTVTADDHSFDSGDSAAGADWQWKFGKPGSYSYHCTPHPWMKGIVRVTP
jgi:plastocyanin